MKSASQLVWGRDCLEVNITRANWCSPLLQHDGAHRDDIVHLVKLQTISIGLMINDNKMEMNSHLNSNRAA
jgi:hypothetical protein